MKFILSRHAKEEMQRRQIPLDLLESVLYHPQQIVLDQQGNRVYQSILEFSEGKLFLLRAIVNDTLVPPVVITVYRTSQINRYWRTE